MAQGLGARCEPGREVGLEGNSQVSGLIYWGGTTNKDGVELDPDGDTKNIRQKKRTSPSGGQ
jgi:hypothetical protein